MRSKLPWILLAISLLVNAGFLAGALQAQHRADRLALVPDARAEALVERLELDAAQKAALEALRERLQARTEAERASGERERYHRLLLAELVQPTYDDAAVLALLEEQSLQRAQSWTVISGEVHGFLQGLRPAQREAFVALAEEDRSYLRLLMFPHWGSRS